ncbi:AraC family transcriptional regulator [Chitinophagaceae bacterium LB-8]|jgi:AraC-like DNA-binding protein|uniref:AraC family transcriptional regulator n=1 Tax=Paraflavisolibacter caeni TaxID=2982496 RepID=A0A9X3BJ94_9BACT|nr:AraC family transcriptional regulator [Paraflavisolibacter caeni]MCU7550883.1 AraC family transcriptional regulator [Paraflavisolibacter caeni]
MRIPMKSDFPKIYIYKRIVQAKLFIDTHFDDCIDLNNIADEAYFSKFHFIRLFKTIYGKTPHQYLTKVRIENAIRLLQKGMSVTDVSFFVGFTSVSSFTDLFKRYTKMSPSAYQRQFMEKQEQIKTDPLQFIPACFAEQKGWTQKSNFQ